MDKIPLISKKDAGKNAVSAWEALPFDLALLHITAYAENVFEPWLRFNGAVIGQAPVTTLPPLLKELVVVQASVLSESSYECGNHGRSARYEGATQAQLDALIRDRNIKSELFDTTQKIVLQFTTEVARLGRASPATLTAMSERFTNRQLVEFVYVIGTYMMNSRLAELGGLIDGDDAAFN
jgi:alkylhydroperoxidase family enzyme